MIVTDSGLTWWSPRIVHEPDPRQLQLDLVAPEKGRDLDPVTEPRQKPVRRRKRRYAGE
jgi:hypothetical protein